MSRGGRELLVGPCSAPCVVVQLLTEVEKIEGGDVGRRSPGGGEELAEKGG